MFSSYWRRPSTAEGTGGGLVPGVEATAASAKLLLESISVLPPHEFWPDDVSYLDLFAAGTAGHKHVTDADLALQARCRGEHSSLWIRRWPRFTRARHLSAHRPIVTMY